MGRPRKNPLPEVISESVVETTPDAAPAQAPEVTPEPVASTNPAVTKQKAQKIKLHAWFSYIDQEGYKVKAEFASEGESVKEVLENLSDFPQGVNRLVNVRVLKGERAIEKALAPHKARAILSEKSVFDFEQVFRGL